MFNEDKRKWIYNDSLYYFRALIMRKILELSMKENQSPLTHYELVKHMRH